VAQAMMTASTDLHDAVTLGGALNPKFLHFAAVGVNVVYASAAACMNAVALTWSSATQHLMNDKVISAVDMQNIIFSVH
jgi:inosine-uridine nucleoside N-ribohydrolase